MEVVTRYQAKDGKEFSRAAEAIQWEERIDCSQMANNLLEAGKSILFAGEESGWFSLSIRDDAREDLDKITKDTALIISYWQCRETPGYKPHCFLPNGMIYVFGDAGSWSGPYGGEVSIKDLIRYARETEYRIRTS